LFRQLLDFVGIDSSRVHFSWVSASEGKKFVDVVTEVVNKVKEKGPFTRYAKINKEFVIHE
jgi:coenzyme F420-reducing hydrogenase delta subunit